MDVPIFIKRRLRARTPSDQVNIKDTGLVLSTPGGLKISFHCANNVTLTDNGIRGNATYHSDTSHGSTVSL